jgi:RNA polymerase sigma-B factor
MLDSSFSGTVSTFGDLAERAKSHTSRVATLPPAAPQSEHDLIANNIAFAESLARRYAGRSGDLADIRQVALLGLVKAAGRFDPSRGFPFRAFAGPTIAGEIKRYLRDSAWVVRPPRSIQERALAIYAAVPELRQALGHEPTPAEIADHLSTEPGLVVEALAGGHGRFAVALDELDDSRTAVVDHTANPAEIVERGFALRNAIQGLSQRDQLIIRLRFVEGLNQREIAAEVGLSQMQVSRSITKTLNSLREMLEDAETEALASQSA